MLQQDFQRHPQLLNILADAWACAKHEPLGDLSQPAGRLWSCPPMRGGECRGGPRPRPRTAHLPLRGAAPRTLGCRASPLMADCRHAAMTHPARLQSRGRANEVAEACLAHAVQNATASITHSLQPTYRAWEPTTPTTAPARPLLGERSPSRDLGLRSKSRSVLTTRPLAAGVEPARQRDCDPATLHSPRSRAYRRGTPALAKK